MSLCHPLVQPHHLDPINTYLIMITFREDYWALVHIYLIDMMYFLRTIGPGDPDNPWCPGDPASPFCPASPGSPFTPG